VGVEETMEKVDEITGANFTAERKLGLVMVSFTAHICYCYILCDRTADDRILVLLGSW